MDNQASFQAPASAGVKRPTSAPSGGMLPARRKLIVILAVIALLVIGAIALHTHNNAASTASTGTHGAAPGGPGAPVPVQTATVQAGNLANTIALTGNISALEDVQVSARITARVLNPGPLEGTMVHAGQTLIQLDSTDLEANIRQDEALIANAQAQVATAVQNYNIQLTQAKQNVVNARAAANADQENYLLYLRGNRPQQILQAKSQYIGAQATARNALITLNQDKTLYAQGAIAKSVLDTAQTNYDVDAQQEKVQQQAYSLQLAGYQTEQIRAAKEQVNQALANLQNQIANQRQVAVSRNAILAAEAVVQQNQAKLAYDQQQLSYATIKSPINGIVAERYTAIGQTATPGLALVRVVNVRTVYYEPTVSETLFHQIHLNDPVSVSVDAIPGQIFNGRVAALYPAADTSSRLFTLRVNVDDPGYFMRPGMFARGVLTTNYARNVPIVPNSVLVPASIASGFQANTSSNAVISSGTTMPPMDVVVVGPNNTAQLRPVTISIATMQAVAVTSGLSPGEQIVVVGQQGLSNGQKLTIQSTGQTTVQLVNSSTQPDQSTAGAGT